MKDQLTQDMLSFIAASPTAFHAAENISRILTGLGWTQLGVSDKPSPGARVFLRIGGSGIIAARLPRRAQPFMAAAAHADSPSFRIKGTKPIMRAGCALLNTEKYGGMIMSSWFDRPLSIAGRVTADEGDRLSTRLVDLKRDIAVMPSLAIHMNRGVNEGYAFNAQKDTAALLSAEGGEELGSLVARAAGARTESITAAELFLYDRTQGGFFGSEDEFIYSPRLDDLENVYLALKAFLGADAYNTMPVLCIFDNEETGSGTKQSAGSRVFANALEQLYSAFGASSREYFASSFLLSIDNAHAVHPSHTEKYDPQCTVHMNGGVVIKHHTNYATDAISSAVAEAAAKAAGTPVQHYYHRSDLPCGSTLGNIADLNTPIYTADIGLAQLAMHSACETAGAHDPAHMLAFLKKYYAMSLRAEHGGGFSYMFTD